MSYNKLIKRLSIGVISIACILPLFNGSQFNVNAKSKIRTHLTKKNVKVRKYSFHRGMPKAFGSNRDYWESAKRHYFIHHHKLHYTAKDYFLDNKGMQFGVNVFNHKGKQIGGSAGSATWWNPYWKYLGNHKYVVLSGIGIPNKKMPKKLSFTKKQIRKYINGYIKIINHNHIQIRDYKYSHHYHNFYRMK